MKLPRALKRHEFNAFFVRIDSLPYFREALISSVILSSLTVAVYYSQWVDLFEDMDSIALAVDVLLSFTIVLFLLTALLYCAFKHLPFACCDRSTAAILGPGDERGSHGSPLRSRLESILFRWSPKSVSLTSMLILLIWSPYIYASYPAYMDWDTLNQIFQFATDAPVDYGARAIDVTVDAKYIDHDTVPTTLVFGAFWWLGAEIGDQNIGLSLYVVFQCAITAVSMGAMCSYLRHIGLRFSFAATSFLFFALFPIFPNYASCMLKDSLFSPFFLLYLMLYVEAFRTKGLSFRKRGYLVALAFSVVCCIATKKAALYIVLLSSIAMLAALRGARIRVLLTTISIAVCYMSIMQFAVYPLLDVGPVGRQEVLSVPFQQTAATAIKYPQDCAEWEQDAISKVLPLDGIEDAFNPVLADPVKKRFNHEATTSDLLSYLLAYVVQGVRHPVLYTEVALKLDGAMLVPSNIAGFMFVTCEEAIPEMERFEGEAGIDYSKPENRELPSSFLNHMLYWAQNELGLFGSMGLFGGWLPILTIAVFIMRSKRCPLALSPVLLSVCVLFLSPTSTTRYVLPLMYCAPLLLAFLSMQLRTERGGFSEIELY